MVTRDQVLAFVAGFASTVSVAFIFYRLPPFTSPFDLANTNPALTHSSQNSDAPETKAMSDRRNDDDYSVAASVDRKVRVLIWVDGASSLIKRTWGPRADIVLYMDYVTDKDFPTVGLNVSRGKGHMTAKTMQAFRYVYQHYFDAADWFMKVDTDTYVIVENLNYFLSDKNPDDPIHYGYLYKTGFLKPVKQGYYSGGAGYVLSKEALRRLATKGSDPRLCRQDGGYEDAELGTCMHSLGVKTTGPNDRYNRSRFHFRRPDYFFDRGPPWYEEQDISGGAYGLDSISDYAITFHKLTGKRMLSLDYYIYHLRPYGIRFGNRAP